MSMQTCPHTIKDIFDGWNSKPRQELVEEACVYLVPICEILNNKYYKVLRDESKALAPGKVENKTPEDTAAGKDKYRKLRDSIHDNGFDPLRPLSFLVRMRWTKILLHQGHHRLAAAKELGLTQVPVFFIFDRQY